MSDGNVATDRKPKDVAYGIHVTELSDDDFGPVSKGGAGKPSPLNNLIMQIHDREDLHGKFIQIAVYGNGDTVSAVKSTMYSRFGNTPSVMGYTFRTKAHPDGKTGLYVKFNPEDVEDGAKEAWVNMKEERARKLAEKKAEKEAAEAAEKVEQAKAAAKEAVKAEAQKEQKKAS